jgi:hypothetical protein
MHVLAKNKPRGKLDVQLKIYPQVLKNACVTDKKNTQNDSVGQKLYPKLLLLLAILATLWFVNPAQNLWCMSWWKDLITIPTRSMWMKT